MDTKPLRVVEPSGKTYQLDLSKREDEVFFYKTRAWAHTRARVLKRDHNECVWCAEQGKVTRERLEVDHIVELKDDPSKAFDMDNLRTLCKACHNRRHGRWTRQPKKYSTVDYAERW